MSQLASKMRTSSESISENIPSLTFTVKEAGGESIPLQQVEKTIFRENM